MSARPTFNVPESLIPRDVGNMRIFNLGRVSTRLRHSAAFMFVPELFCNIYLCFQSHVINFTRTKAGSQIFVHSFALFKKC